MRLDYAMIRRFLRRIDPTAPDEKKFDIWCLKDNEKASEERHATNFWVSLADLGEPGNAKIKGLLEAAQDAGMGLFVTIQDRPEGTPRTAENINRIRALFIEDDGGASHIKLADWPLLPHLIVETSPGRRHVYWIVEGLTLDEWPGLVARLIQDWGSDPAVKDLARVMRLPGTWHQKDPTARYFVEVSHEA